MTIRSPYWLETAWQCTRDREDFWGSLIAVVGKKFSDRTGSQIPILRLCWLIYTPGRILLLYNTIKRGHEWLSLHSYMNAITGNRKTSTNTFWVQNAQIVGLKEGVIFETLKDPWLLYVKDSNFCTHIHCIYVFLMDLRPNSDYFPPRKECVYFAVRTGSLYIIQTNLTKFYRGSLSQVLLMTLVFIYQIVFMH